MWHTEHGGNRRLLLPRVVLVEVHHGPVLRWRSEAVEIVHVSHRLEVAAADQEVYGLASLLLDLLDRGIDCVQLPMPTAVDGHLQTGKKPILETDVAVHVTRESHW